MHEILVMINCAQTFYINANTAILFLSIFYGNYICINLQQLILKLNGVENCGLAETN